MPASFADHVTRLADALSRRTSITEDIERHLLNVQGKPLARERDRSRFEHLLTACFGAASWRELEAAHVADGFEPVLLERRAHEFDPLELVVRAYERWEATRWPGRAGRLAFADVIYSAFVIRQMEHLSLRIWDDGKEQAESRLRALGELLDRLNQSTAPGFVRDPRWLTQTAQGPLTRHLGPYFTVAERIASLPLSSRLEIHKAGAKLAGGHLRSQLCYRVAESGLALDDPEIAAVTRTSNSIDVALLVGDLVALLDAYEAACGGGTAADRVELADAILQGVSADPDLLLTRLDLLGPCTTIEEVVVDREKSGIPRLSATGMRYQARLAQYRALVCRLAPLLRDDFAALNPQDSAYSPLGIAYGFCADLFYNIAVSVLAGPAPAASTLETIFEGRGDPDAQLRTAAAWQALPRRPGEREHFTHSHDWAQTMFDRVMSALDLRAAPLKPGRLVVLPDAGRSGNVDASINAQEYVVTSDLQRALASGATAFPRGQIVNDRREARFLASAEIDGKWFGVSKAVVSALLARGTDAVIHDLPAPVIDILRLTCPDIVVV